MTAGVGITREQDPSGTLAPVPSNNAFLYTLVTPQLSVSYMPDVFGLNKRTVEAAAAQEQASRYQMIAADITLSANVVAAAIQEASLEDQIDATRELIDIDRKMLEHPALSEVQGLCRRPRRRRAASAARPARGVAAAARQAARPAAQSDGGPDRPLSGRKRRPRSSRSPASPCRSDLPLSLPSALVEQRPDVLQAEANMHAASAQVGVATANRLPNITLSANAGSTALAIGQVFGPGTGFWNIGAALAGADLRRRHPAPPAARAHAPPTRRRPSNIAAPC